MTSRLAWTAVLVLATGVASVVPSRDALAAPKSVPLRETLDPPVRDKFDLGMKLYKMARFEDARQAFTDAYTQSGDPRLLYNVAVCDKAMKRYARAILTLRKSLASTDRPLSPEYTQRAAETVATLSRYVAFLTLESPLSGITFTVDGEPVSENPVPLEDGPHALEARKEGYETATRTIEARAGQTMRESFVLEAAKNVGTADVRCAGGIRCRIDLGSDTLGTAPVTFSRNAGRYTVRAWVDGRLWSERTIELQRGRTIDVELTERARLAYLRVTSDKPTDRISVDGTLKGESGVQIELAPGEHRVAITRPDGGQKTVDLLLREDESRDLRVSLEEKKGSSTLVWVVGGGALVAVAATVTTILLLNRPTTFEGNAAGTLNPYVVTASRPTAW